METIFSLSKTDPHYVVQKKNPSAEKLIIEYGNSNSMALSDPNCQHFTCEEIEGIIGYRFKWGHAVVFGDPICQQPDLIPFINEFHKFCRLNNKKVIYTAASQKFAELALKNTCCAYLEVGEEVVLNPQNDLLKGTKARKLRIKIHQAQQEKVCVQEFYNDDEKLKNKIEDAALCWLNARKGPQIYLSKPNLFDSTIGKRWFYSLQNEKVTGVLVLNRIKAYQGWFVSFSATIPNAVKGSSELLLLTAMQKLKEEGCCYLTAGTIPKETLGEMQGIGFITQLIAKVGFNFAKRIFNLNGKKRYWKKFQPNFDKTYLVFEKRRIGISSIAAIITALNGELK